MQLIPKPSPISHNFPSIALLWPTACHHNIMIQEEHEEVQGTNWYKLIIGQTSSFHGLLHPGNGKTCWQPSVFVRETWICCRTSQSAPDACPTSLLILCCTRKYSSTLIQTQKQSINQSERSDKKQMLHGTTLPIPVNLPFLWSTGACLPVVYFIIDMIFVVSRHLSLSNFAVIELFWTVPSITTSSSRTNLREKSSCKVNCHVVHLTHAAINPCLHQASIDHPFGNESQPERPPTIHTAMNSETPKPGINKWI